MRFYWYPKTMRQFTYEINGPMTSICCRISRHKLVPQVVRIQLQRLTFTNDPPPGTRLHVPSDVNAASGSLYARNCCGMNVPIHCFQH